MQDVEKTKRLLTIQLLDATHERLKAYREAQPMRPSLYGIVDVAINQFLDRAGWPS